jgi:hypothetical protein
MYRIDYDLWHEDGETILEGWAEIYSVPLAAFSGAGERPPLPSMIEYDGFVFRIDEDSRDWSFDDETGLRTLSVYYVRDPRARL